jgi:Phage head-tail joining protein.
MNGIERVISRLGETREVYTSAEQTRNEFGQLEDAEQWSSQGTVFCHFEREQRTTVDSASGSRTTAPTRLLFFKGDAPEAGARVNVDGNYYEINTSTPMTTHEVADASLVENFNPE